MRHVKIPLVCLLFLCLVALVAGCGSTTSSGNFSLTADSTVTIAQGSSRTFTVTPTTTDQFNDTVQITISGLPTGVTVAPASASVTPGTATTFTLTATSTATVGTTSIAVQGASENLVERASISLTVTATTPPATGDFTLAAAPSTLALAAGASGEVTLTSSGLGSFSGTIAVAVTNLPTGVTVSPATITVTPNNPLVVTLTAAASAPATTTPYAVGFVGTSGSLTHTATVEVSVTAAATQPADFSLTAAPTAVSVVQGAQSSAVNVGVTGSNGFSGNVALTVTGLPTGVTVTPPSATVASGASQGLIFNADATAATGTTMVTITGTSGTLTHALTVALTVTAAVVAQPDFSLTASTTTATVAQGAQSGPVDIGVTGSNGFSGNVAVTVTGLPVGVTTIPVSATLSSGLSQPFVFNADTTATIGTAMVTITGTSGALTHSVTVALTVTAPVQAQFVTLTITPQSQSVAIGSVATISITATSTPGYTGPVVVTVQKLPANVNVLPATAQLTPGVAQTFTLVATSQAQPGSSTVTFTGKVNSVSGSANLALTVVNPVNSPQDTPTWHHDDARTGLFAAETSLKTTNVISSGFGKLASWNTDGAVDAQPLYLAGVTIGSQAHNVVYVATENDTLYAWDADSGTLLWKHSALGQSETPADNQGCSELGTQVGITATPAIDRNLAPDGAIYFVAETKDSGGGYHHRLHALDLTTGAELGGSPVEIAATYAANGGQTDTFVPNKYVERAALLVSDGLIYLTWDAPCRQNTMDYQSWVTAYNQVTLAQSSVLNLTPNGSGGSIFMSGAGPSTDVYGNVYLSTSEGTFDTSLDGNGYPIDGDYGNGYVKIEAPNGVMSVYDYFEPDNGVQGDGANYADQGTGGVLIVPDIPNGRVPISLAYAAGMDGNIYQMYRTGDFLGEYNSSSEGGDLNAMTYTGEAPNGITGTGAYFNDHVFYGGIGDAVKSYSAVSLSTSPTSQSTNTLGSAGATPVVSANGTNSAILWALDTMATGGAVLHAYNAGNLGTELYNSTQAQAGGQPRDAIGTTNPYAVPVVANGYVFIGTQTGLTIFGLLP